MGEHVAVAQLPRDEGQHIEGRWKNFSGGECRGRLPDRDDCDGRGYTRPHSTWRRSLAVAADVGIESSRQRLGGSDQLLTAKPRQNGVEALCVRELRRCIPFRDALEKIALEH